jgi:type II secretory pathway component PulJ
MGWETLMTQEEDARARQTAIVDAEIARAEEALDRALMRKAALAAEPEQPAVNSVIRFQVQYGEKSDVYTYVAYRAPNGPWFVTGQDIRYSWQKLLELMRRDTTTRVFGGEIRFFLYGGAKSGKWMGRSIA